jgi:hypothetical protein
MYGQKRRKKRSLAGVAAIDGTDLTWELLSEPQWSTKAEDCLGLRISVQVADAARRELILEFPFPTDKTGKNHFLPQRPPVTQVAVETAIRQALEAGWSPESRGKPFVFLAPGASG